MREIIWILFYFLKFFIGIEYSKNGLKKFEGEFTEGKLNGKGNQMTSTSWISKNKYLFLTHRYCVRW